MGIRLYILLLLSAATAQAQEQTHCEYWFDQVFPGRSSNNFIFTPSSGRRIVKEQPAPAALAASDPSFAGNYRTNVEPFPAGTSVRLDSGKVVTYGETYYTDKLFTAVYHGSPEEILAKIPPGRTRATIDKNGGLIVREGEEEYFYREAYGKNVNKYHYLESAWEYRKIKPSEEFEYDGEKYLRVKVGDEYVFAKESSRAPLEQILDTSTTIPGLHFSKEGDAFRLEELMPANKIAGRAHAGPPPSAEEFSKLYPHDPNPSLPKTKVDIDEYHFKKRFFVKSYNPATGEVVVEREKFLMLQGTPLLEYPGLDKKTYLLDLLEEDYPAVVIRGYQYRILKESSSPKMLYARADSRYIDNIQIPVKPNGKIYFPGIEQEMSELKPGMTVDFAGTKYEVRSVNERDMGKLVLRAPEEVKLNWEQFAAYAETGKVGPTLPSEPITTALKPGGTSSIVDRLLGRAREKVPLVGSARRKRVKVETVALDEFESKKTEVDPYHALRDLLGGKYPKGTKINIDFYDAEFRSVKKEFALGDDWDKYNLERALRGQLNHLQAEPPGQPPLHIERQRIKSGERTIEKYFNVSPVEGKVITYEINGLNGPQKVSVAFPLSDSAVKNYRLGRMADDIVAKLPLAHADANSIILLETGDYDLHAAGQAFQSVKTESGNVYRKTTLTRHVIDQPIPFRRIKTLWHETGHQIAEQIWNSSHNPGEEWARAVALDGKFVSGYSLHQYQWRKGKTEYDLVEDMAEAVTAYISSDGGRWNPKLREQFANRFGLLDRIMQAEDIQPLVRQTFLQRAAAAGLTASVLGGAGAGVWYWEENNAVDPATPLGKAPVRPVFQAPVLPNGVPIYQAPVYREDRRGKRHGN